MPTRGGPDLPYDVVAGVTPCPPGWLVASAKLHGMTFVPEDPVVYETFREVVDVKPTFAVIALNVPIGYPHRLEPGGRTCDRMARRLLGRRGTAVQSAPTRDVVTNGQTPIEDHLAAVNHSLLPRIREVAQEMAPYRQRSVFEVHPELSFYQLNSDTPLRWSKRFQAGLEERRALLEKRIPGVDRILDAQIEGVEISHLTDAAAILWTARRIAARAATRIPEEPEWDDEGLRMELVR